MHTRDWMYDVIFFCKYIHTSWSSTVEHCLLSIEFVSRLPSYAAGCSQVNDHLHDHVTKVTTADRVLTFSETVQTSLNGLRELATCQRAPPRGEISYPSSSGHRDPSLHLQSPVASDADRLWMMMSSRSSSPCPARRGRPSLSEERRIPL